MYRGTELTELSSSGSTNFLKLELNLVPFKKKNCHNPAKYLRLSILIILHSFSDLHRTNSPRLATRRVRCAPTRRTWTHWCSGTSSASSNSRRSRSSWGRNWRCWSRDGIKVYRLINIVVVALLLWYLQGDTSPGEPRLGGLWFGMFHHLAQLLSQFPISPGRTRQRVEEPKSNSTQLRFPVEPCYHLLQVANSSRCTSGFDSCRGKIITKFQVKSRTVSAYL